MAQLRHEGAQKTNHTTLLVPTGSTEHKRTASDNAAEQLSLLRVVACAHRQTRARQQTRAANTRASWPQRLRCASRRRLPRSAAGLPYRGRRQRRRRRKMRRADAGPKRGLQTGSAAKVIVLLPLASLGPGTPGGTPPVPFGYSMDPRDRNRVLSGG